MPKESRKKTKLVHDSSHRQTWRLLFGIALILFGGWLIYRTLDQPRSSVRINSRTIYVEVVSDQDEQAQGLSGRDGLEPNQGMLFVLNEPRIPKFWMKDMRFPIDIVWIKEDLTISAITPSIGPDSYPITFSPPEEVKYALEIYAGRSADLGWLPGDTATIDIR